MIFVRTAAASPDAGFSLTEVLVSMFVLALASTAIIGTLPRRADGIEAQVAQWQALLDGMSDDAIASGRPIGLKLDETSYALLQMQDGIWSAPTRTMAYPSGLTIRRVDEDLSRETDPSLPDVIADPTGMVSPATIEIRRDRFLITLRISQAGQLEVETDRG